MGEINLLHLLTRTCHIHSNQLIAHCGE